jgi:ATP-binding protein involved in chromosome partitioning
MSNPVGQAPNNTPQKIEQAGPDALRIAWADGATFVYPVRGLRLSCACAHCVDEWTGANLLDPDSIPDDIHPVAVQSVGRYALQIDWSDGHSTGIYTFERLRELADLGIARPEGVPDVPDR